MKALGGQRGKLEQDAKVRVQERLRECYSFCGRYGMQSGKNG